MENKESEWKNTTSNFDAERGIELFSYGNHKDWGDKLVIAVYDKVITPERHFTKGNMQQTETQIIYDKIFSEQLPDYDTIIAREWIFDIGGSMAYGPSARFLNGKMNTIKDKKCEDPNQFIQEMEDFVKGDVVKYLTTALTDPALPEKQRKAVKSLIDTL